MLPVRAFLLLLPLIIVQFTLIGIALYDLARRKRVKGGNKLLWVLVIVIFEFIGPLIYLILGREEE
jgi:hypothetical protein